jgi:hypothetical protein
MHALTSFCVLCILWCVDVTIASRKPTSPYLSTPTSTFVSIKILQYCHLALHEVRPTTSQQFSSGFEPSQHPQSFFLRQQHISHPERFGHIASTPSFVERRLRVSYVDLVLLHEMSTLMPDPRIIVPAHHHKSTSTHECSDAGCYADGGQYDRHFAPEGFIFLYVPSNIKTLKIQCHNMSHSADVYLPINTTAGTTKALNSNPHHIPHRPPFIPLVARDGGGIQVKALQVSGPPDRVNTIVFLSDGYVARDNSTFFRRIKEIVSGMDGSPSDDPDLATMKATVPFARYVAFWNIFAVFQPSPEAGASNRVRKVNVNDNLGCYYPADIERALQCDNSQALSLARTAPLPEDPDKFLIIVIVNSNEYGGTGLYYGGTIHIGVFFAGDMGGYKMPQREYIALVNHECGHAFGNLADEYDYGNHYPKERPYPSLLNCLEPSPNNESTWKTPIPWQFWIDVFHSDNITLRNSYIGKSAAAALLTTQHYGPSAVPLLGCSYSDYYRSSSRCLMNRLDDFFLCPQCREGASKTLFQTEFEFQWPRRPLEDHLLVLSRWNASYQGVAGGGATLHLPRALAMQENFEVEWFDQAGGRPVRSNQLLDSNCPTCFFITAATMALWPLDTVVVYTAVIRDRSYFLRPEDLDHPFLSQTATFRLIIPSTDPATQHSDSANGDYDRLPRAKDMLGVVLSLPHEATMGRFSNGTVAGVVDLKPYFYRCAPANPAEDSYCYPDLTEVSIKVSAAVSKFEIQVVAFCALCLCYVWLGALQRALYPIFYRHMVESVPAIANNFEWA